MLLDVREFDGAKEEEVNAAEEERILEEEDELLEFATARVSLLNAIIIY